MEEKNLVKAVINAIESEEASTLKFHSHLQRVLFQSFDAMIEDGYIVRQNGALRLAPHTIGKMLECGAVVEHPDGCFSAPSDRNVPVGRAEDPGLVTIWMAICEMKGVPVYERCKILESDAGCSNKNMSTEEHGDHSHSKSSEDFVDTIVDLMAKILKERETNPVNAEDISGSKDVAENISDAKALNDEDILGAKSAIVEDISVAKGVNAEDISGAKKTNVEHISGVKDVNDEDISAAKGVIAEDISGEAQKK